MTLDSAYTNAANSFKEGNIDTYSLTRDGKEKSVITYATEDSACASSIVSLFNGEDRGDGVCYDAPTSKYTAMDNIEDLMEFMDAADIDGEGYIASTNTLDNGTVQCLNEAGQVLYEYRDSEINEAYRVCYDTNGDGIIDENDGESPIYNKVGVNDEGHVLVFETGPTTTEDGKTIYKKSAFEATS